MNVVIYAPNDYTGARLTAMQNYCIAKGMKTICFYRGRTEFNHAVETVCAEGSAVVVDTFSIVSSDVENLFLLMKLRDAGKELVCITEGIDTSSYKCGKALWTVIEQLYKIAQKGSVKARKLTALAPNPLSTFDVTLMKDEITLHRVFADYQRHRKLKRATTDLYELNLTSYLSDWLERPISSVTRAECMDRLELLTANNGPSTANYALALFGFMVKFAIGYYETEDGTAIITKNPVDKITLTKGWNPEPANLDNFIRKEHLNKWFTGIAKIKSKTVRDLFHFLILTGLRREEALTLAWNNVDLDAGFCTIPHTKNHRRHVLPMSTQALAILRRRKIASRATDLFVFSGMKSFAHYGYCNQHKKVGSDIDVPFTPHGLRRTFAVTAAALKIERPVIKKLLNHHDKDVTAIYAVYEPETLREPMQQIADALTASLGDDMIISVIPSVPQLLTKGIAGGAR